MVARILWLVVALLIGPRLAGAQDSPAASRMSAITISAALSAESSSPGFPSDATLRTVSLPDLWPHSRPDGNGPVWYRTSFSGPVGDGSDGLWIVHAERACGQLEAYLNGRLVHTQGPARASQTASCNAAVRIGLPAALLVAGANTLDLRVAGRPLEQLSSWQRAPGLSTLVVGPQRDVDAAVGPAFRLDGGFGPGMSVALALMGAYLMQLGWRSPRRDSHLAYFGALTLGQGAALLPFWMPDLPIDGAVVEFLTASLMPVLAWAAVQFLLRYAGLRVRLADLVMPVQCVLLPLSLLLSGPSAQHTASQLWATILALEVAAAAIMHLSAQWKSSRAGFWVMSLLLLLIAAGEWMVFFGHRTSMPLWVSLGSSVLPGILLVVGMRLIQQRGAALESAETNRALIEQRVAEVKAEIEANYRQLSELRVVQVTDRERKRIAADLHDDLGAKLLTIVHTSESERISTLAREALEEMRLSVRGLTGKPVRLEDALGDWRAEVIARLGQAGIEAVWTMPTEDLPHTLPARAFVQTTRIIREAVNNIIKHSGASQCAVRCKVADGDFQLVIQDNGKGISVEVDGRLDRGHGLSSMKGRAKQLQGQCLVESGPGYGTVIRLTVPLESVPAPA